MKKLLLLSFALLLVSTTVFAAPFSPQLLKITAPAQVQYNFDGTNLQIPVTLTGTVAGVNFFVFTKGKAETISKIQNGFLGWHYMNKIDTCIYFSPQAQFIKGVNPLVWNGKDKNGIKVPKSDYTYYLWGFDNVGVKTLATSKVRPARNWPWSETTNLVEKGMDGKALANPIYWSSYQKWVIGGDPENASLLETCSFTMPAGYGQGNFSCLQRDDFTKMFINTGKEDTKEHGIAKYNWVPNGLATLDTKWATNGLTFTNAIWTAAAGPQAGVETDGTYLYTHTGSFWNPVAEADFRIWDMDDGTMLKKIDNTYWWTDVDDLNNGGQLNGGPNDISERNGYILLNCHCSCLSMVVNPIAGLEDETELVMWVNGNGDHINDHNDDPAKAKTMWMCNDYNVGPYKQNFEADSNLFAVVSSYDMGAVSFSLMAPDGTGVQYLAYAGETAAQKWYTSPIDNGSAFDGLYSDRSVGIRGLWFVAQDSFKGELAYETGVADQAPAAFTVAQNTPNPFNPATTINYTLVKAGKVTIDVFNVAGQKVDTIVNANMNVGSHSVTWNASKFSAGVYFYTVKSGEFSKTMKMTLLK